MSFSNPGMRRAALSLILFTAMVLIVLCVAPGKSKPIENQWETQPFVDLSIDIIGGTEKPDYRCDYYFRLGEPPKSLDFTGHTDLSLAVQKVGRRTAKLRLIMETKMIDIEIGTIKKEVVLDDGRRIRLRFLSSTLPPYDDAILLSDSVEVFRHFDVESINGGDTVPTGMTKDQLQLRLIDHIRKMLTQSHGWAGFDARGDGYEIDVTIDGRPVHIAMTFVSGWIVIKDDENIRCYGFHPDRLKDLHTELDQYLAMDSEHQTQDSTPTK